MIKHMIIQVSQSIKYLNQANKQSLTTKQKERIKSNTLSLSLEAYDLYIFSPFGNKLPKSS